MAGQELGERESEQRKRVEKENRERERERESTGRCDWGWLRWLGVVGQELGR